MATDLTVTCCAFPTTHHQKSSTGPKPFYVLGASPTPAIFSSLWLCLSRCLLVLASCVRELHLRSAHGCELLAYPPTPPHTLGVAKVLASCKGSFQLGSVNCCEIFQHKQFCALSQRRRSLPSNICALFAARLPGCDMSVVLVSNGLAILVGVQLENLGFPPALA